jgi:RNA polymerase sigma-70 factor, ECF subfamily
MGLLSLMMLHDARSDARVDDEGHYVALDGQDRDLWDRTTIGQGLEALQRALRLRIPDDSSCRRRSPPCMFKPPTRSDGVDADRRALRSARRVRSVPGGRGQPRGGGRVRTHPQAGLDLLEPLLADPVLAAYQPLAATHAELLRRTGDVDGAVAAYRRAIELTENEVERDELMRRLGSMDEPGG